MHHIYRTVTDRRTLRVARVLMTNLCARCPPPAAADFRTRPPLISAGWRISQIARVRDNGALEIGKRDSSAVGGEDVNIRAQRHRENIRRRRHGIALRHVAHLRYAYRP
jgi:hypothetical protein